MTTKAGTLYLCATPIGNLEDMTFRAVRVLKEADLIAAEDTRNSIRLLNHFDIHTPMTSYHEYNRIEKGRTLVKKLLEGQNVALITDAGTPGISDPGEALVCMCREAGITVTSVPGACACVTALSMSGRPSRRFCFEGFPPQKKGRMKFFEALADERRTMIFYESPYRVVKCLEQFAEVFGPDRPISVSRELTKKFEQTLRGTVADVLAHFRATEPKGEFVLVVAGKSRKHKSSEETPVDDENENE